MGAVLGLHVKVHLRFASYLGELVKQVLRYGYGRYDPRQLIP